MHLINTKTRKPELFHGVYRPTYATLSHTWGDDEVSLQDVRDMPLEKLSQRAGYIKVTRACERALADGLSYLWADTCCIDKTSSAELSEAINSMFKWYADAEVCYAYLSDLETAEHWRKLKGCRWFSRGWTLQELIAPWNVRFYAADWTYVGDRNESLLSQLAQITGVPEHVLSSGSSLLSTMPVATKMSWAAHRETTRPEDQAYCLLGIFNVSMPLLYGSGRLAFLRLQEEIMRQSNDHTILAWSHGRYALLAPSPIEFASGSAITPSSYATSEAPFELNSFGLHISLPILGPSAQGQYSAVLSCRRSSGWLCALSLVPISGSNAAAGVTQSFEVLGLTQVSVAAAATANRKSIMLARHRPTMEVTGSPLTSKAIHITLHCDGNSKDALMRLQSLQPAEYWDTRGVTTSDNRFEASFSTSKFYAEGAVVLRDLQHRMHSKRAFVVVSFACDATSKSSDFVVAVWSASAAVALTSSDLAIPARKQLTEHGQIEAWSSDRHQDISSGDSLRVGALLRRKVRVQPLILGQDRGPQNLALQICLPCSSKGSRVYQTLLKRGNKETESEVLHDSSVC